MSNTIITSQCSVGGPNISNARKFCITVSDISHGELADTRLIIGLSLNKSAR